MRILRVDIAGFRGIKKAIVDFERNTVLIGPNNCGKSTIVEALALTLGRDRMVRNLTEHDFFGSNPTVTSRIRIVVTIGDFEGNDPARNSIWFRDGRAVHKWINNETMTISPEKQSENDMLCAQMGFTARFDFDTLEVETIRYFHDSDDIEDAFIEDTVQRVPAQLIHEIGFFLVPSSRTWDKTLSFGSELFSRVINTLGKVPSKEILQERDRLRSQESSFDTSEQFKAIIDNINKELSQLLPSNPRLCFRLTSTDSDSILKAMTPHFSFEGSCEVPSSRHGSGLLSLQTMLLLLEFGKARKTANQSFILVIEEPELHLPPAMQKRVVHRAYQTSNQLICTSHSSRVSSFFRPSEIRVLENRTGELNSPPLLEKQLLANAANHSRKLFNDFRLQLIEGLLHPVVLITEGRIEYEWLEHFVRLTETSDLVFSDTESEGCFSAFVGVVASEGSNIAKTCEHIINLRSNVVVLVDGDESGNEYIVNLLALAKPPFVIIQWKTGFTIEDIVGSILKEDEAAVIAFLNSEEHVRAVFENPIVSVDEIVTKLKAKSTEKGLKGNYLAYEEICASISESKMCMKSIVTLLDSLKKVIVKKEVPASFEKCATSTKNILVVKSK